jgi:hypothetical protein
LTSINSSSLINAASRLENTGITSLSEAQDGNHTPKEAFGDRSCGHNALRIGHAHLHFSMRIDRHYWVLIDT